MPTPIRSFKAGQIYHVYSRGNHKDVIFRDNAERKYFLSKLDQFCDRDSITIIVYCLMDNHFHLALRQDGSTTIPVMMRSLLAGYVRMYNAKHGTVGGLFQGRFKAKLVHDEGYMAQLSRYIHLNPHPFTDYRKYRWSSYRQYAAKFSGICNLGPVLDIFGGSKVSYAMYIEKALYSGEKSSAVKPPAK